MTSTLLFEDIFHELDEELEIEANDWHLNHFYVHFEEEIPVDEKWNQPSTSQQHQSSVVARATKKINQEDNRLFFHEIPDYLSASNQSFHAAFSSELRSLSNPIQFPDLQQLTVLTHQMSIIHLHQQLWHHFLQAGTGQLKQREQLSSLPYHADRTTLSFWPAIVTSVMTSQGLLPVQRRDDRIDQDIIVQFVQNYLRQLDKKFYQCQLQFESMKKRLPAYVATLNDKIDRFVQKEGLTTMRLHFQMRIALLDYMSMDRSYQLEYGQQKPTHLQLEVAQHISSLTFDREKAHQELILFKFGVLYKKLPKSLDLLEDSPPSSITTISDPIIRERLSTDYQRIIQRAKADLMNVLSTAAEAKRNDCRTKFDVETAKVWKTQHQLPIHERLTATMLAIIEQRQRNITECVKYIYELKSDSILQP